jgi:phytanoyl-CoA dioxygenase PhyH
MAGITLHERTLGAVAPRTTPLQFFTDGVEILTGILCQDDAEAIKRDISLGCEKLRLYGIRNLEKKFSSIGRLAHSPHIVALACQYLGKTPRLVRALYFDKTAANNWFVAWHQDKTVTLSEQRQMPGWGPWTCKEGVHHVQPPCAVLDEMVTIRLHIDATDETSGCLRVMPRSHCTGLLQQAEIDRWVARHPAIPCIAAPGDAIIMRPHVLHSSGKTRSTAHRRVVHLEYTSYDLPPGLDWA